MKFKHDGYHKDGSMCVIGYDDNGAKIAIFRGFYDDRKNVVTIYPKCCLVPTRENLGKRSIPASLLH